jgi:hypothetical protein
MMLNTLGEFLDRMTAITIRSEEHLASMSPVGVEELAKARTEQARIITSYQLFVHREVFEPIVAAGSPADVARVKALKTECIVLAEEFRVFARSWSFDEVMADWPTYRSAALGFVDRIRRHASNVRRTAPSYLGDKRPSVEWRKAS